MESVRARYLFRNIPGNGPCVLDLTARSDLPHQPAIVVESWIQDQLQKERAGDPLIAVALKVVVDREPHACGTVALDDVAAAAGNEIRSD